MWRRLAHGQQHLESKLGAQFPPYLLLKIKADLVSSPAYLFSVGGIERVFALLIQIGLSLLVLYGVQKSRKIFLLYAILIHALIDFPPAMYQAQQLNIWLVEGLALAAAGTVPGLYSLGQTPI